jgi:hypothetical protein
MNHQKYEVVVLNKGAISNVCINIHFEILVRMLLYLFGQDPNGWSLHRKTIEQVYTPGIMGIGEESLMTHEMAQKMSNNSTVS